MANFIYQKTKQAFLNGGINLSSKQLKVLLINSSEYIPNQNLDEYVSDIPASAIIGRSQAISSVDTNNGILSADNITIESYSGSAFDAVVMYESGTLDSNSRLISYIDTSSGLPFLGLNSVESVTIFWSEDSTKILSIQ